MSLELTEDNLFIYAAKHYYNPLGIDAEEFENDLNRFKYVKRLINRYLDSENLSERLILNHLIIIFNVFGFEPALNILKLKMASHHWPVLKPFLIYLKAIKNDELTSVIMDPEVVQILRKL